MAYIIIGDALPITPNYVTKGDTYWWVTFINVINLDLMEAYVTYQSPIDNQFPCQTFIDYVNSPGKRAGLSKNKGVLGSYPIAGNIPFNKGNPGPLTNPDLLQVIQGLNIVNAVGINYIRNSKLDLTNPKDLDTAIQDLANLGIITPDNAVTIDAAITKAVNDNIVAQNAANVQKENDPLTAGLAAQQLLKNFNDVFNSNFFIDNKGQLVGLNGPNGLTFNNPGLPLQLFRLVDFIEISNLDNHTDNFSGAVDIHGQRQNNGIDFADAIFNIILSPPGQLQA